MSKRLLVVGASGQLGSAIVSQACADGLNVRGLVRKGSNYRHLDAMGIELAFGDLRDRSSLDSACREVSTVISTASVVFPQGKYSFEKDERLGYTHLVQACSSAGVSRLVFISNLSKYTNEQCQQVPTLFYKQAVEQLIEESNVHFTIIRCAPFMDDYFALMGSGIPLRNEPAATLNRRFWFSRLSLRPTLHMIERFGVGFCPGVSDERHEFVAISDVASAALDAAGNGRLKNKRVDFAGPTDISWREIGDIYGSLLKRKVRVVGIPPTVLRWLSRFLRPISPAASNQMAILWLLGTSQARAQPWPGNRFAKVDAHTYLASKMECHDRAKPPLAHSASTQ